MASTLWRNNKKFYTKGGTIVPNITMGSNPTSALAIYETIYVTVVPPISNSGTVNTLGCLSYNNDYSYAFGFAYCQPAGLVTCAFDGEYDSAFDSCGTGRISSSGIGSAVAGSFAIANSYKLLNGRFSLIPTSTGTGVSNSLVAEIGSSLASSTGNGVGVGRDNVAASLFASSSTNFIGIAVPKGSGIASAIAGSNSNIIGNGVDYGVGVVAGSSNAMVASTSLATSTGSANASSTENVLATYIGLAFSLDYNLDYGS